MFFPFKDYVTYTFDNIGNGPTLIFSVTYKCLITFEPDLSKLGLISNAITESTFGVYLNNVGGINSPAIAHKIDGTALNGRLACGSVIANSGIDVYSNAVNGHLAGTLHVYRLPEVI